MKKIARNLILAALAFLVVSLFYPGVHYMSLTSLALASAVFAVFYQFVRPLLKLLTLPFNLLTFGLFSMVSSIVIIYLVTVFVPGFNIVPFHFGGLNLSGFILPAVNLSWILSALLASFLISLLATGFRFLFH